MREGLRHDAALRLALDHVVADGGGRVQPFLDVARLQPALDLVGEVRPHAGEAVGLQLDPHLQLIGFDLAAGLLLHSRHARNDAEQVLHMMARLVRDDVGLRELARPARAAAETRLYLAEKRGVEEDALVGRAVERPHRRLRHAAAAAIGGVAEQHDARAGIGLSAGLEDFAPAIVDLAEHA